MLMNAFKSDAITFSGRSMYHLLIAEVASALGQCDGTGNGCTEFGTKRGT